MLENHQWNFYNYIYNLDNFLEMQEWIGYAWKHLKYYCYETDTVSATSRINVLDSLFFQMPTVGTGSLATSAANVTLLLQEIREHVGKLCLLNYSTDLENQPLIYDAGLVLQAAIRNFEKNIYTKLTEKLYTIVNALNVFFISTTGMSFKQHWNESSDIYNRLTLDNDCQWDEYFREFWYIVRNEELSVPVIIMKYDTIGGFQKDIVFSQGPLFYGTTSFKLRATKTYSTPIIVNSITFLRADGSTNTTAPNIAVPINLDMPNEWYTNITTTLRCVDILDMSISGGDLGAEIFISNN